MSKYESIAVFSVKEGEEAAKNLVEKFKALIEANGTMEAVDEWGVRKLAYEINYETDGYYVLYTFEANVDFVPLSSQDKGGKKHAELCCAHGSAYRRS